MPDLPWFAYLFAVVFWGLALLKVWRFVTGRGRGVDVSRPVEADPDAPRWSPFRDRGF